MSNISCDLSRQLDLLNVTDMCPKNNAEKSISSDRTDCSIDEERRGSISSIPCEEGHGVGFRNDMTAGGASAPLRAFTEKVEVGDVLVGDFNNKTRLLERFAGGSFGELYIGEMINSQEQRKVAVKVESQGTSSYNFLLQEGNVYRNLEGGPGIPQVYWFGYHGPEYGILVMDLLGPTLEYMFISCKRTFTLRTVLMLMDQMLDMLSYVHSKGYVHRDISPSNFVIGGDGKQNRIQLIDFGHAKKYNTSFKMVPRRNSIVQARPIVGTPRFISVHAHLGHEDGPRDDLESLGYVLLYLACGALPWQGIRAKKMSEKLSAIADRKLNIPVDKLCKGLPEEFATFFSYIRGLKLYLELDYDGIKQLFRDLAQKHDLSYDHFDWEVEETSGPSTTSIPIVIPEHIVAGGGSPQTTPPSR